MTFDTKLDPERGLWYGFFMNDGGEVLIETKRYCNRKDALCELSKLYHAEQGGK